MSEKSITLCCIDTVNHWLTMQAMSLSLRRMKFSRAIFVTDREDCASPQWKTHLIKKLDGFDDVNRFLLKSLYFHVNTDFVLVIQYDGFIWKPELWRDEFLKCDYIGAPWPHGREEFSIGTGGFSLRSRRLLQALLDDNIRLLPGINEDVLIGKCYRSYLEAQHGIRYPSVKLASQFALESPVFQEESFGFHGLAYLAQMYAGDLAHILIDKLQPYTLLRPPALALAGTYLNFGREDIVIKFFKRVAQHYSFAEGLKIIDANNAAPSMRQLYTRYWPR